MVTQEVARIAVRLNRKKRFLFVFLFWQVLAHAKPCPSVTYNRSWWGSGACTGNTFLEIPLGTTGLSLVYLSHKAGSGWVLDIEDTISVSSNAIILIEPRGNEIRFVGGEASGIWLSEDSRVSEGQVTKRGTAVTFIEPYGKTRHEFSLFGSRYLVSRIIDRNGNFTRYIRDTSGNLTEIQDGFGQKMLLTVDGNGRHTEIKDIAGTPYMLRYDYLGRLSEVSLSDGTSYVISYKGETQLVEGLQAPNRGMTLLTYYPSGDIFSIVDPFGWSMEYRYTDTEVSVAYAGQVRREIFGNGAVVRSIDRGADNRYIRDGFYNPVQLTDTYGNKWVYTYTAKNRVKTITGPTGQVTQYTYTPEGYVTQEKVGSIVRTYTYQTTTGLVLSEVEGSKTLLYSRDVKGNLLSITKNGQVEYKATYDSRGFPITITDRTGFITRYGYDSRGNVSQKIAPTGITTTTSYNSLNLPVSETESGLQTTLGYDSLGRLTSSVVEGPNGKISSETSHSYTVAKNQVKRETREASFVNSLFSRLFSSAKVANAEVVAASHVSATTTTTTESPSASRTDTSTKTGAAGYSRNGKSVGTCKEDQCPKEEEPSPPPPPCEGEEFRMTVQGGEGSCPGPFIVNGTGYEQIYYVYSTPENGKCGERGYISALTRCDNPSKKLKSITCEGNKLKSRAYCIESNVWEQRRGEWVRPACDGYDDAWGWLSQNCGSHPVGSFECWPSKLPSTPTSEVTCTVEYE